MPRTHLVKCVKPKKQLRIVKRDIHSDSYTCDTAVLHINSNKHVKHIKHCLNLAILSIIDSKVCGIYDCPILYSLKISQNSNITKLKLSSVRDAELTNLDSLQSLRLPMATKVTLNNLPQLQYLNLSNVSELELSNMTFNISKFELPNLESLNLTNVHNFPLTTLNVQMLRILIINNCDISRLTNLNGCSKVVIKDCETIASISNIANSESIKVINCPNLLTVGNIVSNHNITISRCNALTQLDNIQSIVMSLEYCFSLVSLNPLPIDIIRVIRCPSLSSIKLFPDVKHLHVDSCNVLAFLEFDSSIAFGYSNLCVELIGNNHIDIIKDWFVNQLIINDNSSLVSISNVYNLSALSLNDCREVETISNMFVQNTLSILNCPCLEDIDNLCGFSNLVIHDCMSLTSTKLYLTKLAICDIMACPDLNIAIDGSRLTNLKLVDSGRIIIMNLILSSRVFVKNIEWLPDIGQPYIICETGENQMLRNAVILASYYHRMHIAANQITSAIKLYTLRRINKQYDELNQNGITHTCAICLELHKKSNVTITPCSHMFHKHCLQQWIRIRQNCPLCNNDI